ncbi:MAG: tripartite tricarboxylate transporter TctB family protein [Velocimicrobium sp.]
MIKVVYSTEHWIVPIIIMIILAVLLLGIIATEGRARIKVGGNFFEKPGNFFIENCDYLKLGGTLVLFVGYIACLNIIGFTVTSIIFVFLFNLLYAGIKKKAVLTSVIISVVSTLIISVMFGVIFNITLPDGLCSITFVDFGFTLY